MTREEAIKYIKSRCIGSTEERDGTQWSEAMWTAIEALSADAVEVVRCKDCKCSDVYQSDSSGATAMYCRAFTFHRMVAEDDYCSCGERREP